MVNTKPKEIDYKMFQRTQQILKQSCVIDDNLHELDNDGADDMWSESDASEYRREEKHVEMDNHLMDRLYKAATQRKQDKAP